MFILTFFFFIGLKDMHLNKSQSITPNPAQLQKQGLLAYENS